MQRHRLGWEKANREDSKILGIKVTQMIFNLASQDNHQDSMNVVPEVEGISGVQQCPQRAAALLYRPGLPDPRSS